MFVDDPFGTKLLPSHKCLSLCAYDCGMDEGLNVCVRQVSHRIGMVRINTNVSPGMTRVSVSIRVYVSFRGGIDHGKVSVGALLTQDGVKSGNDALGAIQQKAFEAGHCLFGVLRGQCCETYAHTM